MGLFRKAGEKFEETKRTFLDDEEYVCRSCEETLSEDYAYCPHCGEQTVESAE